ncbi:MAG TPA: hypothetical protein VKP10_06485 [Gemmatimonadales bacterium]|nr:hypothetical protein [Gemmatimonadales bacterium]
MLRILKRLRPAYYPSFPRATLALDIRIEAGIRASPDCGGQSIFP